MRPHILRYFVFLAAPIFVDLSLADDPDPVKVNWSDDWRRMEFTFQGQSCLWPDDVVKTPFPPPGRPPEIAATSEWPVVTLRARWSIPMIRLEEKYRPQVRDLVLMYTCDAQLYEWIYPQIVRSSQCRCPKEFVAKANDPFGHDLAEALRGKLVSYQITANLKGRDYFVAFHIGEGNLEFEGRMYKDLAEGASAKDVEEYLDLVKNQYVNLKELAENYRVEEQQVLP